MNVWVATLSWSANELGKGLPTYVMHSAFFSSVHEAT